jgi:hypothetical protein
MEFSHKNFRLTKAAATDRLYKIFFKQAQLADFGFADDIVKTILELDKKPEELTIEDMKSVLKAMFYREELPEYFYYFRQPEKVIPVRAFSVAEADIVPLAGEADGIPDADLPEHLKMEELLKSLDQNNEQVNKLLYQINHIKSAAGHRENSNDNSPEVGDEINEESIPLFTDIMGVSFDAGGLIVMECFGSQIYELYTADGKLITGPCHDLELLPEGKFLERSSDSRPGFYVSKYYNELDYVDGCISYGDLDSNAILHLAISGRDRILFEGDEMLRVETFDPPKTTSEASDILSSDSCNYVTSPDLVRYYHNNRALAMQAIEKDPYAFTLLSASLQKDSEILRCLLFQPSCYVDSFIYEYKMDVAGVLTEDEILNFVSNGKLSILLLPDLFFHKRDMVLAALKEDRYNTKEIIEKTPEFIRDDEEIMMLAVTHDFHALQFASDRLKRQRELVLTAIKNEKYLRVEENEIKKYSVRYSPLFLADNEIVDMIKKIKQEDQERFLKRVMETKVSDDDLPF